VLAGVRRDRDADAIRGPGIEPLIIDITNPEHIQALATRVQEDPQGRSVRALVNNAGIGVNVPVEAYAAAKVIAKAVTARKPRTRYTVGRDAAVITRLARILPDRTLDHVIATGLRRQLQVCRTPAK
jgi:NAD(P)-dependent dehydrogenase (short-subunit alcohol dehydrogenase family)